MQMLTNNNNDVLLNSTATDKPMKKKMWYGFASVFVRTSVHTVRSRRKVPKVRIVRTNI